eukprot:Blabericola_migrator_1__9146@NODE_4899_length_940_cov_48_635739_g3069_i0_p1_GENE_NODE_4899_length_940_cov_48_635739_g3069_i0NODE_4899_length_940_cov_48_635739_g3069_i0_p1_ORF_typecomplete_len211_score43_26_NODE_4899_length_940_cov_48_635739_g3069_i0308892
MRHHFDHSDQGLIGLLFREVFDLHPDVTRTYCGFPVKDSRWAPSVESDELVFVRPLNLSKALTHPVYRIAAQTWFPDGRFWPGEPTSIAIVAARWMNSPVCNDLFSYTPQRLKYFAYTCGDMFAHFNGCSKREYYETTFRNRVVNENWCRQLIPFKTNDNNTGLFDYEEWVRAARQSREPHGQPDPSHLNQYGF